MKQHVRDYICTVITVSRKENTPEWMEYLAERTNEMIQILGDTDETYINGFGEITIREGKENDA